MKDVLTHKWGSYGVGPCTECGATRNQVDDNIVSLSCPRRTANNVTSPPYFRAVLDDEQHPPVSVSMLDDGGLVLFQNDVTVHMTTEQRQRLRKILEHF